MNRLVFWCTGLALLIILAVGAGCTGTAGKTGDATEESVVTVTDAFGRTVSVPSGINRIICSGGSCIRYIVYMDADEMLAAATGSSNSSTTHETRPYIIANPQFADLPSLGSSDSSSNLEMMVSLQPQLIFTMGSASNLTVDGMTSADNLQVKTGIPVIAVASGAITTEEGREQLYTSFRQMGLVLHKEERAEELAGYIEATLADLERRTGDIPESEQKRAYVGGLSHSGAHGLISTQPRYPPFDWVHVKNIAGDYDLQYVDYSKESLLMADPEIIFIDGGTLNLMEGVGAFDDIRSPIFSELQAVKNGKVYAVLPYNCGGNNIETTLADAYYVGKVVYPDRFADIDPEKKADEIYTMFVGKPVFSQLKSNCNNLGFNQVIPDSRTASGD